MATKKATAEQVEAAKARLLELLTPYTGHRGQEVKGDLLFNDEGGRSSFVYRVYIAVCDRQYGRPGLKNVTQEVRVLFDGRWDDFGGKIRVPGSGFNHMRHVADTVSYALFGDTQALNAEEI